MLYTYLFFFIFLFWIIFTTNLIGGGSPALSFLPAPLYVLIRCVLSCDDDVNAA